MQDGVKDELAETVADEVNPDKTFKLMAVAAAARKLLIVHTTICQIPLIAPYSFSYFFGRFWKAALDCLTSNDTKDFFKAHSLMKN